MSDTEREQTIRERAHSLWEAEGKPEGRDQEYWLRAERLLAEEHAPGAPNMENPPPL